MVNYFFISSPLHFFVATNLSIGKSSEKNIAIFISKDSNMANLYGGVALQHPNIFSEVHILPVNDKKNKRQNRANCFRQLDLIIQTTAPDNIYTGNDARVEFQYAMFKVEQIKEMVQGIYTDDGIGSYLEHRSMNNFSRKYIETLIKKWSYGSWWKRPLSIGGSDWVSQAYVAFPELVHKHLQQKALHSITPDNFQSRDFLAVNNELLSKFTNITAHSFGNIKAILCLTHESIYLDYEYTLLKLKETLASQYHPDEVAIKAHPRSQKSKIISTTFPKSLILPSNVGLELFLPLLSHDTKVIGDISTSLLTTKWLRPDIKVEFYKAKTKKIADAGLQRLFKALSIKEMATNDTT